MFTNFNILVVGVGILILQLFIFLQSIECLLHLGFYSRKLSPTEQRYTTFDRKLLSVYLNLKIFRHFLERREFAVFTDHKPLTTALFSKSEKSPRQIRRLEYTYISIYN